MLETVQISNYQSLKDISLTLSPYTVIIGPSSSGKSAFTRALRTLVSNQRGDSFITHGEQQATIKVTTEKGTVALDRGKKNEYTLIPNDYPPQHYTKLNGSTPEEVSEFLGIPSKDPLNFANQFDMPYLLTSSPAEVARILGALTNVSVIFEASREANRRRLNASQTLKTRAADYEQVTNSLKDYETLSQDLERIERAEETLSRLKSLESRISGLTKATTALKQAQDTLANIPEPKSIPDISPLVELHSRMTRLRDILKTIKQAHTDTKQYDDRAKTALSLAEGLEAEYFERLAGEGTCPTCKQSTSGIGHSHTRTESGTVR